jgi:azurin
MSKIDLPNTTKKTSQYQTFYTPSFSYISTVTMRQNDKIQYVYRDLVNKDHKPLFFTINHQTRQTFNSMGYTISMFDLNCKTQVLLKKTIM